MGSPTRTPFLQLGHPFGSRIIGLWPHRMKEILIKKMTEMEFGIADSHFAVLNKNLVGYQNCYYGNKVREMCPNYKVVTNTTSHSFLFFCLSSHSRRT